MAAGTALALHAHPDDIEFMMAGTLVLLRDAGYETHYLNVADGCCGSMETNREETAAIRLEEAREAAKTLGAVFHPPLAHDLEIFYEKGLLQKVAACIREINPAIVLLPSPQDYMEDHMNACRLGVTATFTKGMPNYITDPPRRPVSGDTTIYHGMPWGLCDPLGNPIHAEGYVDVSSVMEAKRNSLACHRSQKEWLDATQGIDSYITTLDELAASVGKQCGRFAFAEGWRKHLHLGFSAAECDPLADALGDRYWRVPR